MTKKTYSKLVDEILDRHLFYRVKKMGGWKDCVLKIGVQPTQHKTPTFDSALAQQHYEDIEKEIQKNKYTKKCQRIVFKHGHHRLAGLEIITKLSSKNQKKNVVSKTKSK